MAFKAMGGMRSLVKMGTQKGRWRPRTWRPEATTDMWKRGAARKPGGKLQGPADAGEDDVPLMSGQPGAEVLRSQEKSIYTVLGNKLVPATALRGVGGTER